MVEVLLQREAKDHKPGLLKVKMMGKHGGSHL